MNKTMICLAALALVSCGTPTDSKGGGANANRVVSGTIAVPNASYWAHVKLGVFSGSTYTGLGTDDNSGGVGSYRVTYYDSEDTATDLSAEPVIAAQGFTASDTLSRSYTFELPPVPAEGIVYYYAAWYDGDDDGFLGLKNADAFFDPETAAEGEYNRSSTKVVDDEGTPLTVTIDGFQQGSELINGVGKYKYLGHGETEDSLTNFQDVLGESTNSGFDFEISDDSGW